MSILKIQDKAPDFELKDKDGVVHKLSDYLGQKIVVYFYPRDNTPGCTRQACAFASAFNEYEKLGVKVIGISKDSEASHERFSKKYDLPFILLSDPDRSAIEAYGVWQEKKLYGKLSFGIVRSTFLIDERGMVEKIWPKAKPDTNAEEILQYLRGEKEE